MKLYLVSATEPVKRPGYVAYYLADLEFPEPLHTAGAILVRVPAGGRTRAHTHNSLDELFIALTEMQFGVIDTLYDLGPGDVILVERGEIHWFEATATKDALAMAIKMPNVKEDKVEIG